VIDDNSLPVPPLEMRELVGQIDPSAFRNLDGENIFPELTSKAYENVVDFGSGCGRLARRMMLQRDQPHQYLGIEIHKGMVEWCQTNLTPAATNFKFVRHDAFNLGLNPEGLAHPQALPINTPSGTASLVIAWSVFTHLLESQVYDYLSEMRRILREGGLLLSTWFLFDKSDYPMMQQTQNALYINDVDPTNATIFDRQWLLSTADQVGLVATRVIPPNIRGFHWTIEFSLSDGRKHVLFPQDDAPTGHQPPPVPTTPAHLIGLSVLDVGTTNGVTSFECEK
jgi:SAM-dependent methyltransferase